MLLCEISHTFGAARFLLAAHSIPAKSSGDFKPVQLGDACIARVGGQRSPIIKAKDESVLVERRATFSARLRAARESKGVSLQQIAASSKINVSLLKGLESGDVSRWPKGLYRRSYLRDYLRAVGLPVETNVADFVRLFPDEEDQPAETVTPRDEPDESPALSLTLDGTESERSAKARRHAGAAGRRCRHRIGRIRRRRILGSGRLLGGARVHRSRLLFGWHRHARPQLRSALGGRSKPTALEDGTPVPTPQDSLAQRIRRLRELSVPGDSRVPREIARVAWSAILLRIPFLR